MSESPPNLSVNVWNYKPWWCQPWSILLTGIGAIAGSWVIFHRLWVTGLVAIPMLVWMGYFLLVYPQLFRQAVEQNLMPVSKQVSNEQGIKAE